MNPPLVSISIPLYQCESFIIKCLQSIKNQGYPHIEVLLINDQTQDKSVALAEEFIHSYQLEHWHIHHLTQNSGLSVVRNTGIDLAKGEYLYFMDSDDTLSEQCIETLVSIAQQTSVEMVMAAIECVDTKTQTKYNCIPLNSKQHQYQNNSTIFRAFANGELVTYAYNKLIKINFLKANKLYFKPGLFAQDELWTFHCMMVINSLAIHKTPTYQYYLHPNSVIHNRNKRHFDNWLTILEEVYKVYVLQNDNKRKKQILQYMIHYKTTTLVMNWKAKRSPSDWLYSFGLYQNIPNLSISDYFSKDFPWHTKKKSIKLSIPKQLAFWWFKKSYI